MSSIWPTLSAIARGIAIFASGFVLLNLGGGWLRPGFDANSWWLDLRRCPTPWRGAFLLLFAATLLSHGAIPRPGTLVRAATVGVSTIAIGWAILDSVTFLSLLRSSAIHSSFPLPFSLLVAAALVVVVADAIWLRRDVGLGSGAVHHPLIVVGISSATLVTLAILFPLAQMVCFGKTDYRRPADVAVVFGCLVYRDGRLSDALKDRVDTGCDLYRQGLVDRLIFSGGPGPGSVHETEAMRRRALELGVPESAILLDPDGVNTRETVRRTTAMLGDLGARRVLAVSHFYHLPRIRLTYQRAGWNVYTVPARESYWLSKMPLYMAREVAALWYYWARPLAT